MTKTFLIAAALASPMPALAGAPPTAAVQIQAQKTSTADLGLTALRAKNHSRAFLLFTAGADQGDPLSTFYLAGMYARGEGVRRDDTKAVALYREVAEAGDATPLFGSTVSGQAMYALATIYQRGTRDIRINEAEAVRWYRRWTATVDPLVVAKFPLPRTGGGACFAGVIVPINGYAPGEYDTQSAISAIQVAQDRAAMCGWQNHIEQEFAKSTPTSTASSGVKLP